MTARTRYAPRFGVDLRIRPEEPDAAPVTRACDHPGCRGQGDFRAPKDRNRLNDYYWFCVDHVREYNLSWDYFRGMSADAIESYQKNAMTGHRPTWKLGQYTSQLKDQRLRAMFGGGFSDGQSSIGDEGPGHAKSKTEERSRPKSRSKMQLASLEALNLDPSATWEEVRHRYKELVKKFHPDANGGDRSAEDRLKQVIKAYGQLRSSGFS